MKTLAASATIGTWIGNLRPERLEAITRELDALPAGGEAFVPIAGSKRTFRKRFDGTIETCCWWGRSGFHVPLEREAAIALVCNFAEVVSRSAGRNRRSDFAIRELGGR